MPESWRASAIEYFTNIVAMMKNPAAIATCHRSRIALTPAARRSAGRPGGERAAHVDRARQLDRRLEAEHDQRDEQ